MSIVSFIVYVLCDAAGFLLGYVLPEGPWTPYAPILIAYHLFLIFLLAYLGLSGEQKLGISMPIAMTALTHLAFLAALIGVVFARQYVPLFGLVRYALPALAPFEAKWLFEGKRKRRVVDDKPLPAGTAEDYNEFLLYLRQKNRPFQKPGRSVRDEFEAWNADRAKRRAAAEAAKSEKLGREQGTVNTGP